MKQIVKSTKPSQAGFSLVEIMAAIAILGIVGGLVAYNVSGSLEKAKVDSTRIALSTLKQALESYRRDCHHYPNTSQGLSVLVTKPPTCKNWQPGGYLEDGKIPLDSWDNEFIYYSPGVISVGAKFEIISYGADGAEGGADNDADINSNKL